MLSILELDERFGLARGEEVVIPAIYDAVWPLLDTFWGIRAGNVFGVLAADGSEICPCALPATYWGYAQLQMDQELEAALATKSIFINYLQTNFAGLQTYDIHEGLFQPARWWAETVTPHLATDQGELYLYSTEQCLVLTTSSSWYWLDETPFPCVAPLICATHTPVAFTEIQPQESRKLHDVDFRRMLSWHLQLTSTGEPTQEEIESIWLRQPIFEDENTGELEELLSANGIAAAMREDISIEMPALTPAVRRACEKWLLETISGSENTHAQMSHLIYLAWLWANGYVQKTCLPPYYVVDARYIIDSEWFDNVPIQEVYLRYQLQALAPLLAEMTRGG